MLDLDAAIRERHSTRMFLPQQPVPRALVDEALALAGSVIRNGYIEFHITVCQFGRLVRLVLSRHSTGSLRLVGWLRFRFQLAALAQQAPSPLTSDPPPPTGSFVLFTIIPGCSTGKAMQVKSNAGRTREGSPIWIGHSLRLPLYSLFLAS